MKKKWIALLVLAALVVSLAACGKAPAPAAADAPATDKSGAETGIGDVRAWYLSENWTAMAGMIRYPIIINGTQLDDADAFLGYMEDKTISADARRNMTDEDCQDLFANYQGIMMGNGEVWLSDPDVEPKLEIIGINGIVSRSEAAEASGAGAEGAREDGERFETVILLEGMEETVRYMHIINDLLGYEIDYEYETFVRDISPDRDRFLSIYDDAAHPENYLEISYDPEDIDTVVAAVSAALSLDYTISVEEAFPLTRAGSCIRIDASADKTGEYMPDHLQMVYIVPTDSGCFVARAHYSIESAEGFGRRIHYMMNSFAPLAR